MRALVLGCGEAFDHRYPNTSILVRANAATILFDCGYSVPPRVWAEAPDPSEVDIVYISHPHADHYFGLPALLGRMWEQGRQKPLVILSQPSVLGQIRTIMELGYRGLAARFQFTIDYRSAEAGGTAEIGVCLFDFAETNHSVTNYAVRLRSGGKTFCYSGDGMFRAEGTELFTGADLLVHEAFQFEPSPVHAHIGAVIAMADERQARRLALVHLQRDLRSGSPGALKSAMAEAKSVEVSLPEPGAMFKL